MTTRRGILYVAGALAIFGPLTFWAVSALGTPATVVVVPVQRQGLTPTAPSSDLEELARLDPMALVRLGLERYDRDVQAYRCTFVKQERLGGKLSDVQKIEVRYREQPHAVYMLWQENADSARRALYMDTPEFRDKHGKKVARIEPNGSVARLFVKDIKLAIDCAEARKASRRSIDEFGFRSTYELLITYNTLAEKRGVLDLRYGGTGTVDGRPTFVLIRDLPYDGGKHGYPDARMVLHIDQEWLLPVAVYSYADHDEKELLGSYVYANVNFNPQFGPDAFKF